MKRFLVLTICLLALVMTARAQSTPPVRFTEVDGSPSRYLTVLKFPNGSLAVTGNTGVLSLGVTSGTLTSTAIVTGGGGSAIQTPSATSTLDSSGNISIPGTLTTGAGGSGAGAWTATEGTVPGLVANAVIHSAASDVVAGGEVYIWGSAAAANGVLRVTNASGKMTVTQDAGISHLAASTSADLLGVLSDETGSGLAVFGTAPVLTSATITTKLSPTTDDGAPLGDTTHNFSDLFLASGAVINFANSNVVVTHSSGILTMGTGDFRITTVGTNTASAVTVGGTQTLTNKTLDVEGTGNVITIVHKRYFQAATCNNATPASLWDLPTTTPAAAACVTGTNTQKGVLDFADTSGGFSAQANTLLPADFTGTVDAKIIWTTTATSGNAKWSLSTICTATDGTETDDAAFNAASTVTTAAPGTANRVQSSTITGLTMTGCAAGEFLHLKIFRDGNDAADTITATARLFGIELTIRRAQ